MAPAPLALVDDHAIDARHLEGDPGSWRNNATPDAYVLESWGQGFVVGALVIMSFITISNMRKGVFLHKLILLELLLAMSHGTFCFMSFEGYGWYLSSTAALLYISTIVHNFVAWLKIRPFLNRRASRIFIVTLCIAIPANLFQVVNNFRFFNNISDLYVKARPFECLMRDPWWVFACILFFYVIKTRYTVSVRELMKGQPRFAIMILAMLLSMIFTLVDILSCVIKDLTAVEGINPYWKLALVFKALTDTIILDDFKTCLDKLRSKLVHSDIGMHSFPPPLSQTRQSKEFSHRREGSTTICYSTSPPLATQGPRRMSVREHLTRISTQLSPLQSMFQMQHDISPRDISPSDKGRRSGSHSHSITQIRMDMGLNKFVNSVVGKRSASLPTTSPFAPIWPEPAGVRRGLSIRSHGGGSSSNPRSSTGSEPPTMTERTPASFVKTSNPDGL